MKFRNIKDEGGRSESAADCDSNFWFCRKACRSLSRLMPFRTGIDITTKRSKTNNQNAEDVGQLLNDFGDNVRSWQDPQLDDDEPIALQVLRGESWAELIARSRHQNQ